MTNLQIRDAKRADIAEIGRIHAANYHDTYGQTLDRRLLASVTEESSTQKMEAYWLAPGNEMMVAVEPQEDGSEKVLGFCAGTPSPDVLGTFWLEQLHIDAPYRGQGVGKALLFAMGRRAKATGYPEMVIDVFAGNDKAEEIYRHLGAEFLQEYRQDVEGFGVLSTMLIWRDLGIFE